MSTRYDALTVREYQANGETKKSFTKVGTMFENQRGGGFTLKLDALPLDGTLLIVPPRDTERQTGSRQQSRNSDDSPF